MKKLLLLLLFLPIMLNAQDVEIPKKSNRLVVENSNTSKENFSLVKELLSDKGIEIESQDSEIGQIKSGVIAINKTATGYLIFKCKNNSIIITGMYKTGIELEFGGIKDNDPFSIISNKGMKGSFGKLAFEKMNSFAKQLGTKIRYEVTE